MLHLVYTFSVLGTPQPRPVNLLTNTSQQLRPALTTMTDGQLLRQHFSLLLSCTYITCLQSAAPACSELGHNLKNTRPKDVLAGHLCMCPFPFWWHFCAVVQHLHFSITLHDSYTAAWSFQDERTSKQQEFWHMCDPFDQLPVLFNLLCWPDSASHGCPSLGAGRWRLQWLCSCLC